MLSDKVKEMSNNIYGPHAMVDLWSIIIMTIIDRNLEHCFKVYRMTR